MCVRARAYVCVRACVYTCVYTIAEEDSLNDCDDIAQ